MGRKRYALLILILLVASSAAHLLALRIGGNVATAIEAVTFLATIWPSWRISVARARDAGRGPRWVLRIYGIVLCSLVLASISSVCAMLGLALATLGTGIGALTLIGVALRMEITLFFAKRDAVAGVAIHDMLATA